MKDPLVEMHTKRWKAGKVGIIAQNDRKCVSAKMAASSYTHRNMFNKSGKTIPSIQIEPDT